MVTRTLVAFALLLAGCSDGTSGTAGTSAASAPPAKSAGPRPFDVKLVAEPKVTVGQASTASVRIEAKDGYHVNPEYPIKFTLKSPEAGVEYPSPVIKDVTRTETTATLAVPFKATAAGSRKLEGEAALSVCTEERCVIEKVPLEATVVAE